MHEDQTAGVTGPSRVRRARKRRRALRSRRSRLQPQETGRLDERSPLSTSARRALTARAARRRVHRSHALSSMPLLVPLRWKKQLESAK